MVEDNWPIFVCFVSSPLFSRCGIQTCKRCLIVVPCSIFILRFINIYSPTTTVTLNSWLHLILGCWPQVVSNWWQYRKCLLIGRLFLTVNYLNEAVVAVSRPCQTLHTQDCIGCCNVAISSAWTLDTGQMGGGGVRWRCCHLSADLQIPAECYLQCRCPGTMSLG